MKRPLIHVALLACLFSSTAMAQVQVGSNANASASETAAVGDNAQAVTHLSTAIGARPLADGGNVDDVPCVGDTAEGNEATSLGCSTTSMGNMDGGTGPNRYFQANGDDDGTDDARAEKTGGVAAGRNAAAMGFGNVAIGEDALAESGEGMGAVAIGMNSHANGASTTVVGDRAYAEGDGSTALGSQTIASDGSLAAGVAAKATGQVSTAVGPTAQATGRAGTALGNNARAQADYATAIGSATAAQQNGTTVGTRSAAGVNAAALGYNAQATHTNSVAIGANTRTTGSNQVAMGNRQVTQVADGRVAQGSTDAVNGGQLWTLQKVLDDRWIETNRRLDRTDKRINGLGAQTAAMAQMAAAGGPYGLAVGEVAFNAGVGLYGNEAAIAVGWSSRVSERVNLSAGVSFGTGNTKAMGGVGLSIRFGR